MRDDIKPPLPVKEAPMAVPPAEPSQPAEQLAAPAPEPSQTPVKRQSGAPVGPIIFAVIIFVILAACAYAVFRGM